MNDLFEIKFSIFEDDKDQFKNMGLEEFENEYSNIYGMFTLIFDGIEFIPYIDVDNCPLEARRLFSEIINVYFDGLIYIVNNMEISPLFFLKYVENDTTWLRISVSEEYVYISEIELELNDQINNSLEGYVSIQSNLFDSISEVIWGNVRIEKEIFKSVVIKSLLSFINEIKSVNNDILKSRIFIEQIKFLTDNT